MLPSARLNLQKLVSMSDEIALGLDSLGAGKPVSRQAEVGRTVFVCGVLGPCPCASWMNCLLAVYECPGRCGAAASGQVCCGAETRLHHLRPDVQEGGSCMGQEQGQAFEGAKADRAGRPVSLLLGRFISPGLLAESGSLGQFDD